MINKDYNEQILGEDETAPVCFVIGDIHGRFQPVREFYLRHNTNWFFRKYKKVLICLGDFGANFYLDGPDGRDAEFKRKLGRYGFTYFVIRGNHEQRPSICAEQNPDGWHEEIFFDNKVHVENDFPYIKYALDFPAIYNITCHKGFYCWEDNEEPYEWNERAIARTYKTLILPGAYSVDKFYRLSLGRSWFPQEQLDEVEMEQGRQLLNIHQWKVDLVLSHTCPICYEPTHLFLPTVDQSMVDKSMERYLGEIESKLDYGAWCWGHYHSYLEYPRTGDARRLMLFNDAAIELSNLMGSNDNVCNLTNDYDLIMTEDIIKL